MPKSPICIRRVDDDEEHEETILNLDWMAFEETAPRLTREDIYKAHWWIAYDGNPKTGPAIAYAAVRASRGLPGAGYLCRVGVLTPYRGLGLQRRLIETREIFARRNGWSALVTDCTPNNLASANSLIRAGFKLYKPPVPWALANSLYWKKELGK